MVKRNADDTELHLQEIIFSYLQEKHKKIRKIIAIANHSKN